MKITPLLLSLAMAVSSSTALASTAGNAQNVTLGQQIQSAKIANMNVMYSKLGSIQGELSNASKLMSEAKQTKAGVQIDVDYAEIAADGGLWVAGLSVLAKVIGSAIPGEEIVKNLRQGKWFTILLGGGIISTATGIYVLRDGKKKIEIADAQWNQYKRDFGEAQKKYDRTLEQFIEQGKGLGMTLQGNVLVYEGLPEAAKYIGTPRGFVLDGLSN